MDWIKMDKIKNWKEVANNKKETEGKTVLGYKAGSILFAYFSASALTTKLDVGDVVEAGIEIGFYQRIYKLLEVMGQGLRERGFLLFVLTLLFLALYWDFWLIKGTAAVKYSKGLSLFLAIMYTAGMGFAYGDTLSVFTTSAIRLQRAEVAVCGFYAIYLTIINMMYYFLNSGWDISLRENRIIRLYDKNPFLFQWAVIMGIWLIHLILRYPGIMSYDNAQQLEFYFGYETFTTAQPIFHTVLFGFFVQLGLWMGSANIGLFLFVVFQSLVMSCILAYSLTVMEKSGIPCWLRLLSLGIYCFVPYYAGYASFPIKDYLYTAFFVLLLLLYIEWFLDGGDAWTKKRIGVWTLAGCLVILLRNNGIYIYVPVAVYIAAAELKHIGKKEKQERGRLVGKVILGLILPLATAWTMNTAVTVCWNVQKDSPKEMFSLPFQQTARYVRDYGNEVTEEEREAISAVLDYETLPDIYMPMTADPVKTTYHAGGTEELAAYFKTWFAQFLKHPFCYVEATWNQNYYIFSPNIDNIVYNKDCTVAGDDMEDKGIKELIEFKVPEKMHGLCAIMVSFYSLLHRLPVINILSNVAFYIILLFVFTFYFLRDKQNKALWVLMPLWLTLLIILASPQIQNQPRYAFPIIYSMPSVAAFYYKIGN